MGSGSNQEQSILYTKGLQVLHRKWISVLTGLKVSPLTCKCVFYGPELMQRRNPMELNFASLEIKHTNGQSLKLVSAIFYEIFVFSPNNSPSKTMKSVSYFIKKAFFVLEIFKML